LERATKERTNGKSLFISKTQRKIETDAVALEFQKFLSNKNESGWVELSKGSDMVLSGHWTTILQVLEEFEKWKELVSEKGFKFKLIEYHKKVREWVRFLERKRSKWL
jgi:hypothetical protein